MWSQVSRFQVNKVTHLYTFTNLRLLLCMLGSYLPDRAAVPYFVHRDDMAKIAPVWKVSGLQVQ
jgi:hypothetical protein